MRAPMTKRICPKCGRAIADRGLEKCPNLRNHIAAHDKPKPKKEPAPPSPRQSTGPWWYVKRHRHGGCWAFNHRGKRYFAPIDWGIRDRDKAVAWHAEILLALDPGYTGPKPVRTTRQGHRRFHVALSRESVAFLDWLVAERVAANHTAVFRRAVAALFSDLDAPFADPREPAVRKAFNLLPEDLEMVQGLALQWNTTYSHVAEHAIRRLAERVSIELGLRHLVDEMSQNELEAVREVEAEEQQPVVKEETDGLPDHHQGQQATRSGIPGL